MFVPFEKINDRARVWVYQSNRKLNSEEIQIISNALSSFTDQWLVHGDVMHASFDIRFNHFVILAADEHVNAASGCSIDDSVRTLKKIGSELNVDFFDRTLVAFQTGDEVFTVRTGELKAAANEGRWNQDTVVFNNLVATKEALNEKWRMPAGATWLKRHLPQRTVVG